MPLLSKEERRKFIETLEKDKEFRYTVMGLLSFRELLDRFSRLEERQQRLEERQQRLEERQQRLEERMVRLEERQQRLEERQLKLEERQQRLEEEMRETRRLLSVIAHRFGISTEVGFRETMRYVIEEVFDVGKVEK